MLGEQDGLLGMALRPDLLKGKKNQDVYLSYTYDADPGPGLDRRQKLVRYTYNAAAHLAEPKELIAAPPRPAEVARRQASVRTWKGTPDRVSRTMGAVPGVRQDGP